MQPEATELVRKYPQDSQEVNIAAPTRAQSSLVPPSGNSLNSPQQRKPIQANYYRTPTRHSYTISSLPSSWTSSSSRSILHTTILKPWTGSRSLNNPTQPVAENRRAQHRTMIQARRTPQEHDYIAPCWQRMLIERDQHTAIRIDIH